MKYDSFMLMATLSAIDSFKVHHGSTVYSVTHDEVICDKSQGLSWWKHECIVEIWNERDDVPIFFQVVKDTKKVPDYEEKKFVLLPALCAHQFLKIIMRSERLKFKELYVADVLEDESEEMKEKLED